MIKDKYLIKSFKINFYIKFSLLFIILVFTFSCSYTNSYHVRIGNIGKYGVILLDSPIKIYKEYNKFEPGRSANDGTLKGALVGHPIQLPKEISISWQLADLNNCSNERPIRNKPGYFYKYDCDWTPLKDKIFTKVINLREAKRSEAFREKGRFDGLFSSRRKAALLISFDDTDITVRTIGWSQNKLAEQKELSNDTNAKGEVLILDSTSVNLLMADQLLTTSKPGIGM